MDTNVWVAAVVKPTGVCARLVDSAASRQWRPVVSPLLLTELEQVLRRPKFRRWLTVEEAASFIASIGALAEVVADPPPAAPGTTRDPGDDYLVALARSSAVDAIVSGDEDVRALVADVRVLGPAELLARLAAQS